MSLAETGLFLDGLRCAGCVRRVERELRGAPGVAEASVNYTTHRALVRFDPGAIGVGDLAARVEALGYRATPYDPERLERPALRARRAAWVRLLVAAFLAGNVMLISLALYLGSDQGIDPVTRRGLRWLAVALTLPAVSWCALPFWKGAWAGLRRRELTLDVPVVLGASVAFGTHVAATLAEATHIYTDSASMIVFLILLGRTLEGGARARAAGAVERLAALVPKRARKLTDAGVCEVDAASLRPGDRVVVPAGEAVPTDGRVVSGASEVDESLLTGESRPVLRSAGDAVTGGTSNLLGELVVEVGATANGGTVARMAALLDRAQAERPSLQRLADRVAGYFAPAVLAVAALTAVVWAARGAPALDVALTAAAVLIVACPCALGLATPAAVAAALGRAASLGILVRSGEAIERLARVDSVLLDKTGTLSEGRLAVDAVDAAPGTAEREVLRLAAAAEGEATHPVARAVRTAAAAAGLAPVPLEPRKSEPGRGVVAGHGADCVLVGSRELLEAYGARVPTELEARARSRARAGASLAYVARSGLAVGLLSLVDPPRRDAPTAVARLRALGLEVELASGDHREAVVLAARRSGIASLAAGVTPEEKLARVRGLRARGRRVLAAGDGINDAAALGAADVGVAMGEGADVAIQAADVVVRAPRVGAIADAIELARSALRRMHENLGLALAYNAVAVPLAIAGLLPPLAAAIAMSLSSLAVTGNALRLTRFRPRS
jgi:Cu2+-exporting ATPase